MRLSSNFIPTLKEVPSDAVIPSHQLMLRAGMMRPLSAGVYSFLPFGFRLQKKVMEIVRQEMDAIGGQEFLLPALNPVELWEETGRVKAFGDTMFHIKNRPYVLAPTHEEVICLLAKNHIKSYRDLPQIWYQIQTKFRNEPRPRSGVIRGRQFVMKDSYSLDATWEGLDKSYDLHAAAYRKIFDRAGLKYFVVGASSGAMGGSASQEFMVESEAGEDTCAVCGTCDYAANMEIATSKAAPIGRAAESKPIERISTPGVKTIDDLKKFLKVDGTRLAKSLVYMAGDTPVMVLLVGNDQLNESKLQSVLGAEVRPMHPDELMALTGADAGSIGPVGLTGMRIVADKRLEDANGLVSGANENDVHIGNIDLRRDARIEKYADLRTAEAGEACASCGAPLRVVKAIELGHIFKLGTKYADALHAYYLDDGGKEHPIIMGSYGIGIERIIACHIEQSHDANGIIWSKRLTPFHLQLILVSAQNESVVKRSEQMYADLQEAGFEVLYDDRKDVTPGFRFKDADLLGMPLQIILGEKNVVNGNAEIKERATGKRHLMPFADVIAFVRSFYS